MGSESPRSSTAIGSRRHDRVVGICVSVDGVPRPGAAAEVTAAETG
ncbi:MULTISPECIES: hypothetical protein [Streptomyces]|nr:MULTISPECIES: hypothetical protein [Streptomyces]